MISSVILIICLMLIFTNYSTFKKYPNTAKTATLHHLNSGCMQVLHNKDKSKLEDLKVLRRSPDLLNNFKTGQGQLQLIIKHILFYHIWGLQPFWSSNLNNLTAQ